MQNFLIIVVRENEKASDSQTHNDEYEQETQTYNTARHFIQSANCNSTM